MSDPALQLRSVRRTEPARRLLVITYHFPPDGAVGGLRWAGLSKYLARRGWEVHVITAASAPNGPVVAGLYRHHCERGPTLNELYLKSMVRFRRRSQDSAALTTQPAYPNAAPKTLVSRLLGNLRMMARIAMGFPDNGRGWVLRAALTARAAMRERSFDAVITSGPPHSAHFAGVLATIGRRVPHIIDMRDPWRGANRDFPAYGMDSNWLYPLIGGMESILFRQVRHVVVNTREFATDLQRTRPRLTVSLVSNGTDVEALPSRTTERFENLSIAYVGTFYAGRSFTTVLSALGDVVRNRPGGAEAIKLRIAGNMDPSALGQLQAELAAQGLTDVVQLHGVLPRSEALRLLQRSHLALVLAQAQPTQVPAKLYECVGLGVPTLVLSEANSATANEARRIGAIVVESGDVAGMRQVIERLLDGRLPATIAPVSPISYDELAGQMDHMLRGVARPVRGT